MDCSTADLVAITSYELEQYLELQAIRITSSIGSRLKELMQVISQTAIEAGELLLQAKYELQPKAYRHEVEIAGLTPTRARKYLNLAKTFAGFEPNKLINVELSTLWSLCTKTKAPVVKELSQAPEVNQQVVEEVIARHYTQRKQRQQEPVTGWKRNKSGGGRHYAVVLHDEDTGVSIEQQALESGLLPQKVIQEAISLRQRVKEAGVCVNDYVLAQIEELPLVEDRARELESERQLTAQLDIIAPDLDKCKTWQEVAHKVRRDRTLLLDIVRHWTLERRSCLAELLAAYLRTQLEDVSAECAWVPPKLLSKALAIANHVA